MPLTSTWLLQRLGSPRAEAVGAEKALLAATHAADRVRSDSNVAAFNQPGPRRVKSRELHA